jgi:MoxR-like ATPase
LDDVITRITKSKRVTSVRILNEVRGELLANGIPTGSYNAPQSSVEVLETRPNIPAVSVPPMPKQNGSEPYVPQNGEVEKMIAHIAAGHNILLTGPTGCGKTHLVAHVAALLGKTYETVQGEDGCRKEDIIGYRHNLGEDAYTYGILPRMMQTDDGFLYWDEPNMTPDGVRSICFAAMDHRRQITLPDSKGGEVIKAKKGFVIIGSMNEGRIYRSSMVPANFRNRWGCIIDLGYLPEAREKKLLVERTGIDKDIAAKLCAAAKQIRASVERGTDGIKTPISTRNLLACCHAVMHGLPIADAVETSIVNQVDGCSTAERKAVADVLEAHLGLKRGAK